MTAMTPWIIPALLAFFIGGLAIGRAAREPIREVHVVAAFKASPLPQGSDTPSAVPAVAALDAAEDSKPPTGALPLEIEGVASPKRRALLRVAALLPRDSLLENLFAGNNPRLEKQLFDCLMATSTQREFDLLLQKLEYISSPEVRAEVLSAFRTETNRDRRLALAWILGENWYSPEMRVALTEAFSDPDVGVAAAAMKAASLADSNDPDGREKLRRALRCRLGPEIPKELRIAAVQALRGTDDESDVRLLLESLQRPEDSYLWSSAIGSLPFPASIRQSNRELSLGVIDGLLAFALHGSEDLRERREAAEKATAGLSQWRTRLGSAEVIAIEKILGRRE